MAFPVSSDHGLYTALQPGQFMFRCIGVIGSGGLGTVQEVVITRTNQSHPVGLRLAVKCLNNNWKNHPTARQRFEREITTIAKMRHPSIVSFEGENLPGGERFYVMPRYSGSLRDLINANRNGFPWPSVARFGATIAKAAHYAHRMGYIHRDLKPENILLDRNNNPILSDWGLGYFVHKYSKVLDLTHGGMGTEYYCSPEQWFTGKCDARGDIFSLGMLLAETIRGNRVPCQPCSGIKGNVICGNSHSVIRFNEFIRKMTAARKELRPTDMGEVQEELTDMAFWNDIGM